MDLGEERIKKRRSVHRRAQAQRRRTPGAWQPEEKEEVSPLHESLTAAIPHRKARPTRFHHFHGIHSLGRETEIKMKTRRVPTAILNTRFLRFSGMLLQSLEIKMPMRTPAKHFAMSLSKIVSILGPSRRVSC